MKLSRKTFYKCIAFAGLTSVTLGAAVSTSQADTEMPYQYLANHDGVNFYERCRIMPSSDGQEEVLIKVENSNSYRVTVDFNYVAVAATGEEKHNDVAETTLRPGQTQSGEAAGLWTIPFKPGMHIVKAGVENVRVTK